MRPRWILGLLLTAAWAAPAAAQAPTWQFRWEKGQALTYKVKHATVVTEVVDGKKSASESNLDLVKRWQVVDVDAQGVATVQLTLVAMRNEQKRPDGETLLFDSQAPDKGTPELREQMGKFVGQTLAVLRVDPFGNAVDVKQGSLERYRAEPPFVLVFPRAEAKSGQSWRRPFTIALDPPQGTGEKYEASQRYTCTKIEGDQATLEVKTEFKTQPETVQERLPLLQKEVEGVVSFDLKAGRLRAVSFTIDRTLNEHQGPGSSYHYQSRYSEQLFGGSAENPANVTPVRVQGGIAP